jgi:hypothetical protein
VRAVARRHNIRLVEVDIESDNAGATLAAAFGINESCWGVHNKNTKTTNARKVGDDAIKNSD